MLVSQDADLPEMAALRGPPPKVIWLRGGNRPTAAVEAALRRHHTAIFLFAQDPEAVWLELWH